LLVRVVNTPTVYKVTAGELLKFDTQKDFYDSGYNFSDVLDIRQNTLTSLFTNNIKSIMTKGTLYRVGTSSIVYIVGEDGKSYRVASGDVFNEFGFSYQAVKTINQITSDSLTYGGELKHLVKAPDASTWAVYNKTRSWISPGLSMQYTTSPTTYVPLATKHINNLIIGKNATSFMRSGTNETVYYISSGQKHTLTSPVAYHNSGGTDWSDVLSVSPSFTNNIATGQPIN
jgi:Zn/Cd-binding protein ZinT